MLGEIEQVLSAPTVDPQTKLAVYQELYPGKCQECKDLQAALETMTNEYAALVEKMKVYSMKIQEQQDKIAVLQVQTDLTTSVFHQAFHSLKAPVPKIVNPALTSTSVPVLPICASPNAQAQAAESSQTVRVIHSRPPTTGAPDPRIRVAQPDFNLDSSLKIIQLNLQLEALKKEFELLLTTENNTDASHRRSLP